LGNNHFQQGGFLCNNKYRIPPCFFRHRCKFATDVPVSDTKCSQSPQTQQSCGFADKSDAGIHPLQNAPFQKSLLFLCELPICEKTQRRSRVDEKKEKLEKKITEEPTFIVNIMLGLPNNPA